MYAATIHNMSVLPNMHSSYIVKMLCNSGKIALSMHSRIKLWQIYNNMSTKNSPY